MFKELKTINNRPKPFEFYTAEALWTDEHTSEQMLQYHLNLYSSESSNGDSENAHRKTYHDLFL